MSADIGGEVNRDSEFFSDFVESLVCGFIGFPHFVPYLYGSLVYAPVENREHVIVRCRIWLAVFPDNVKCSKMIFSGSQDVSVATPCLLLILTCSAGACYGRTSSLQATKNTAEKSAVSFSCSGSQN